ncbi:MAG TPA: hypothetical protein VK775_12420 [Chthoniobacterales bacterium]|nr:hypothetical protein [Chthoniobacterales bacterium]
MAQLLVQAGLPPPGCLPVDPDDQALVPPSTVKLAPVATVKIR